MSIVQTLILPVLSLLSLLLLSLPLAHAGVTRKDWGRTSDGKPVTLYTLNDGKLTMQLCDYGARIVSLEVPDRDGRMGDVVLGFPEFGPYEEDKPYFGGIVGRFGNRIDKGQFAIDGKSYQTATNEHGDTLHGGPVGFNRRLWTARMLPDGVEMTLASADGDMGFPGTLTAHVTYMLQGESVRIEYSETTDKPTVVNLTNHTYWNLNGDGKGTVADNLVTIDADRFTPVRSDLIPTGQLAPVAGTPFDFQRPVALASRMDSPNEQLQIPKGYDHNFVLTKGLTRQPRRAIEVYSPESGRVLTVLTTEPGLQIYSGQGFDGTIQGKYGVKYRKYAGLVIETQHFPDSPNQPGFPTTVLSPGRKLTSTTVYRFSVRK